MTRRHGALVMTAVVMVALGVGVLADGRAAKSTGTGDVIGTVTVRNGKASVKDLSRVVVFIDDDNLAVQLPKQPPQMRQVNMTFDPPFLVVQRGTTVAFPNRQHMEHNVYSGSIGNSFDLSTYRAPESKSMVFNSTGDVDVGCRIHDDMRAKIYVVPNKFFDRRVSDGKFRIDDLPPGKYKLTAWMPAASPVFVEITIEAGKTTKVSKALELVLSPEPAGKRRKDDVKGRSYE